MPELLDHGGNWSILRFSVGLTAPTSFCYGEAGLRIANKVSWVDGRQLRALRFGEHFLYAEDLHLGVFLPSQRYPALPRGERSQRVARWVKRYHDSHGASGILVIPTGLHAQQSIKVWPAYLPLVHLHLDRDDFVGFCVISSVHTSIPYFLGIGDSVQQPCNFVFRPFISRRPILGIGSAQKGALFKVFPFVLIPCHFIDDRGGTASAGCKPLLHHPYGNGAYVDTQVLAAKFSRRICGCAATTEGV